MGVNSFFYEVTLRSREARHKIFALTIHTGLPPHDLASLTHNGNFFCTLFKKKIWVEVCGGGWPVRGRNLTGHPDPT